MGGRPHTSVGGKEKVAGGSGLNFKAEAGNQDFLLDTGWAPGEQTTSDSALLGSSLKGTLRPPSPALLPRPKPRPGLLGYN